MYVNVVVTFLQVLLLELDENMEKFGSITMCEGQTF